MSMYFLKLMFINKTEIDNRNSWLYNDYILFGIQNCSDQLINPYIKEVGFLWQEPVNLMRKKF